MQIVIQDNRTLRLAQVFEAQEEVIVKRFRVKDPQAFRKTRGSWDGYHYHYKKKSQTLEKGFLKDLIELCKKHDFPFDVVDLRDKPKYPVPAPGSFDNKFVDVEINGNPLIAHSHQMRCWNSICYSSQHAMFEIGTHFHPTGGGKSLMMAGVVKLIRCPTVIITEQTIVLNQITKSLKLFEVVHHDDIGEFYSGKMPEGNVVCVGSIAALQTPKKPIYGKFSVKESTLRKDFIDLVNNNIAQLQALMSPKRILSLYRSEVLDRVRDKFNSKSKKENKIVVPLLPEKCHEWNDSVAGIVYCKINKMFKNDRSKLEEILGIDSVKIWDKTKVIDDVYNSEFEKAFLIFYEFEKKKYFDITMKGYKTRVAKTRQLQEIVGKCELLLVDEMDNASSSNYDNLFNKWFKGRYIHGFSGTPYDPDSPVENMKLVGRFGPVISRSTRRELENIGQIQPVKYYMMQFGNIDTKDKTAYDIAERKIVIDNPEFHEQVAKTVANWPDDKHLIIVDTSNIEDLGKALEAKIPNSVFLYGKVSQKKRNIAIEEYENGNIKVLIVSKVGKRGMDLGGGSHTTHIIGGGKKQSNFDQIIGRAVRKNDRGWTRVIDYYFTGSYYLTDHARKKMRYIVEMGYNSKIMFGTTVIDIEDFIKSRYKIPKEFVIQKTKNS